jgi:hypothetical protein
LVGLNTSEHVDISGIRGASDENVEALD